MINTLAYPRPVRRRPSRLSAGRSIRSVGKTRTHRADGRRSRGHAEVMDRIAIIDAEAQRLADVLSSTDPDARCPTCPDWTASDLLWHLTEVHYFWAGVLGQRVRSDAELPAVEQAKPQRPSALADTVTLRAEATAALLRELANRERRRAVLVVVAARPDRRLHPADADLRGDDAPRRRRADRGRADQSHRRRRRDGRRRPRRRCDVGVAAGRGNLPRRQRRGTRRDRHRCTVARRGRVVDRTDAGRPRRGQHARTLANRPPSSPHRWRTLRCGHGPAAAPSNFRANPKRGKLSTH